MLASLNWVAALPLLGLGLGSSVMAFDMSLNTNLAVYWGQNSYGATHTSDTANWQQPISYYCGDSTINTFPIAFLDVFYSTGGLPSINLANICNDVDDAVFPGTDLPNCSFLASGIEACQAAGKIVTISLGGATGGGGFASDAAGQAYAKIIWDLFLGGSSTTRPFGAAVLDGIDMDIEGGSQTGYPAFITALRALMNGGSKKSFRFHFGRRETINWKLCEHLAPQCPYPDAYIGTTLNAVGFDAVYVQFYNNYCGLTNYNNVNAWDFNQWCGVVASPSSNKYSSDIRDTWAKTVSPNRNVKVYIGAPASSTAAGSGYVSASTFATIIQQTQSQYSSFGGVMLWDASQAYANGRYDLAVKAALTGGSGGTPTTTPAKTSTTSSTTTSHTSTTTAPPDKATTTTTTTTTPTTTAATGSCSGVAPWQSTIAYVAGDEVTYNGDHVDRQMSYLTHLIPDALIGPAGDWTNDGACAVAAATAR
ncbi:glycoside hydrolase family 18 protein [Melanogaster broomeanus]|nr:glycoside hydrolase family 18 protein [Melanogaster broomeanus]